MGFSFNSQISVDNSSKNVHGKNVLLRKVLAHIMRDAYHMKGKDREIFFAINEKKIGPPKPLQKTRVTGISPNCHKFGI